MVEKYIVESYCIDRALSKQHRVILTFITYEYCNLMLNWYKHLKKLSLGDNVLVICLDKQAYTFSKENDISCLHIDQDKLVEDDGELVSLIKKAYIEKHHICKIICVDYITKKYNTCIMHSDIDMIFLKDPFSLFESYIKKGYDACAYIDMYYSEFLSGKPIEKGGYGFNLVYGNCEWFSKFINRLKESPLLIDHNDVGFTVMQKHFSNIKIHVLNSFLFTTYDLWKITEIRNNIKDICYCIHYSNSENTWMCNMSDDKIKNRNTIKLERLKEYEHWLL